MPRKCIIYSDPSGNVYAKNQDNISLELSDQKRIKKLMKNQRYYEIRSLGLTPSGVYAAYFIISQKKQKKKKFNPKLYEMLIFDLIANKPIFSFHNGRSRITSISLKSGANLRYTIKTYEGTFSRKILRNGNKGAGIRPINKKIDKTSPYLISSREIFIPKKRIIIESPETILFPQEMHLSSLEKAFLKKAPERIENIDSFFD